MASTKKLAATIASVVEPGMKPSEVIDAVRAAHGKIAKKEIARAALHVIVELAEKRPEVLKELYDFSLRNRVADDRNTSPAEISSVITVD